MENRRPGIDIMLLRERGVRKRTVIEHSVWSAAEALSTDVDRLDVRWVSTDDELVVGGAVVSLDADSERLYDLLEPEMPYTRGQ